MSLALDIRHNVLIRKWLSDNNIEEYSVRDGQVFTKHYPVSLRSSIIKNASDLRMRGFYKCETSIFRKIHTFYFIYVGKTRILGDPVFSFCGIDIKDYDKIEKSSADGSLNREMFKFVGGYGEYLIDCGFSLEGTSTICKPNEITSFGI